MQVSQNYILQKLQYFFRDYAVSNSILICFLLVPIGLSSGVAYLYHAGFVVTDQDAIFATETLKDLLLETGQTSVSVGGVSRNVSLYLSFLPVIRQTIPGQSPSPLPSFGSRSLDVN